jgi:hypothetical protein
MPGHGHNDGYVSRNGWKNKHSIIIIWKNRSFVNKYYIGDSMDKEKYISDIVKTFSPLTSYGHRSDLVL